MIDTLKTIRSIFPALTDACNDCMEIVNEAYCDMEAACRCLHLAENIDAPEAVVLVAAINGYKMENGIY